MSSSALFYVERMSLAIQAFLDTKARTIITLHFLLVEEGSGKRDQKGYLV